jgi:hypothetical protein
MSMETLSGLRKDIELLMRYAVPDEHLAEAVDVVHRYEGDAVALRILHNFYSYLPEALDDGVRKLRLLARRQGTFLFRVTTFIADYFYVASSEEAFLVGRFAEGIQDGQLLEFFEFEAGQELLDKAEAMTEQQTYVPANEDDSLCPVCSAALGEYHTLGCPVEVCPWCDGQLTQCNCRFRELGVEELYNEADLERLQERLEAVGRIPFESSQRPGYPTMDDDDAEDSTSEFI